MKNYSAVLQVKIVFTEEMLEGVGLTLDEINQQRKLELGEDADMIVLGQEYSDMFRINAIPSDVPIEEVVETVAMQYGITPDDVHVIQTTKEVEVDGEA